MKAVLLRSVRDW